MATQKDVAKRAGVSFITVSRVINNQDNVHPETKDRVLAAIRELNYHPNHLGRALNSGKNRTVGIVTAFRFEQSLEANLYLIGVLAGIELACREHRYDFLISTQRISDPDFDWLRLYNLRKVDGLIFMGLQDLRDEQVKIIERDHIPCVTVGDRPLSTGISWVDTNNEEAAYDSTKRLIEMGHSRIAFVGTNLKNLNVEDRCAGYRQALREAGVPERQEYYYAGHFSEDTGVEAFRQYWRLDVKPTAIVAATDMMAQGVIREAGRWGLRIPEDLSVVGFDGFPSNRYLRPALETNQQPLQEMGYEATSILIGAAEGLHKGRVTKVLRFRPIEGQTTASPVNVMHDSV